jgi:hypothetical protein
MYKLLIRPDFDGKGLNKNTAESIVISKYDFRPKLQTFWLQLSNPDNPRVLLVQ